MLARRWDRECKKPTTTTTDCGKVKGTKMERDEKQMTLAMIKKQQQAIHDNIFTRKLDTQYMHKCAVAHLNLCKWRQFGNYEIIGIPCISSIMTGLNFYFNPYANTRTHPILKLFSMLHVSMYYVCTLYLYFYSWQNSWKNVDFKDSECCF